MSQPDHILEPGTQDARDQGCTCQIRDGEPSDNDRWPDWIIHGCPLHYLDVGRRDLDMR